MTKRATIDADEIKHLAELAKVPTKKHGAFRSLLLTAIQEAKRGSRIQRKAIAAKDGAPHLDRLRRYLARLIGGPGEVYLDAALAPATTVADLVKSIDHAIDTLCVNPKTRLPDRGARRGTRNRPDFDTFVSMLVRGVYSIGGSFNCYNSGDGKAGGTFPKFLRELSGHLPPHFISVSPMAIVAAFKRARPPAN